MRKRGIARASVFACVLGAMVLALAAPAAASGKVSVYTGQHEAGRINFWTSTDDFRVSDTRCDKRAVYGEYQRQVKGAGKIKILDVPLGPDRCGIWYWDRT